MVDAAWLIVSNSIATRIVRLNMSENEKKKSAPYLPFATFISALDNVAAHSVPNIIDRSSFPSFSGQSVTATLSAFRFFDLIDATGAPLMELHALAMQKDDRAANIKALLESHYAKLIALDLSRTTPSQFDEAFAPEVYGVTGETRVKAKTFFIKAAQFAKLPMSKLLLNKARASGPRKKRKVAGDGNGATQQATGTASTVLPANSGTTKTIALSDGGSLTITANVNLLTLSADDRTFLFKIIDLMTQHESDQQSSAASAETPDVTAAGA
jgi:hypothetical protein